MTLNNLEFQNGGFSVFLQFAAAVQISGVNCDEMDGDTPRQPANRLLHVLWTLFKLLVQYR